MMINPILTAPKRDPGKIRVIFDLSYPPKASVNHFTPRDSFLGEPAQCALPKFEDIVSFIVKQGEGSWLYSVDVARAYRSLKICPGDINLLGINHRDKYYVDLAVAFGLRNGANYCQGMARLVNTAHIRAGHDSITYVDDMLGGVPAEQGEHRALAGFTSLTNLLEHLGWPSSLDKNTPPATRITYCGLDYDSVAMTVELSQKRREKVLAVIDS